ncbi:MAG: hypothetical protein ACJ75P_05970 [Gaiellaceae bacterium]
MLSFPELQGLWQRAGASYGIPWQVLASINLIEPNFGQNMGPTSYLQVWDDGLAKVAASVMTVEEVGRVLP